VAEENVIDTLSLEVSSNSENAEKAIERLANSLVKLSDSLGNVNFGNFSSISSGIDQMATSMTHFSETVKTADFTRIATGLNKLSGVDVQGVSDASRAISTLSSNLSQIGMISFDSQGIMNIANAIAQLGRNTVTQAADNIPRLKSALSGLISEMNGLQAITFDMTGLSNLVSSITKLGGKSATAAIPNIQSLGIALKKLMSILSTAPEVSQNIIQMTQALAQLASRGNKASSISTALISGINGIGNSAKNAKSHTFNLASAFGKFYATYWLILRSIGSFKKAIDISSSLTEVQNVVDVTFGDMKQKVEDLAATSIQDFGMSELTAKQISSRFQAMGVAMGFTQERMSDMSIELTKLAADMASFYNVEQDAVAQDLESIFTGATRPLRQYGLDLTNATLQEWALAQGMQVDIQKMSQAEKTMLRYQYVLANTSAAQGDFARTSGSWANQTRILAQQFEQLGSIVGEVIINTFKPFVTALNSVMKSVIAFARTVADALGKIFGWTMEIGSGGMTNDFEAAGEAADEMADGIGEAADNLKKMQKYIAPWHEVNNMTTKEDTGGGKGGGAGGGIGDALGDASSAQLVRTEGLFDMYKSEIDKLYDLGSYISEALTSAMNSINWESVYQGARNFGSGLAQFLNGLISPDLFRATGQTVAGALNTAIYGALSFGMEFDWENLGLSISEGVNGFFETFDFASLAQTINTWVKGILDSTITALDNTDWDLIGEKIGTFLEEIDFLEIMGKVAIRIWKTLGAALETWVNSFETAPFETALVTALAVLKFPGLGNTIAKKIQKEIAESITKKISFSSIGAALQKKFTESTFIQTIITGLSGILTPIQAFFTSTLPSVLGGALSSIGSIFGLQGAAAIAAGGAVVVAAAAAAIAAIVAVVTHWDEIKTFFTETIPAWWNDTALPFFQGIPEKLGEIWEKVKLYASEKLGDFVAFIEEIPGKVLNVVENIGQWFNELPEKIGYALGYALGTVTKWATELLEYLSQKIPEIISNVINWFKELPGKIYNAVITVITKIAEWGGKIYDSFKKTVSKAITSVVNWFKELPGKIYDAIIKIKEKISKWGSQAISFFKEEIPKIVNKVIEFFSELPGKILDVGENIIRGLWDGISNMVGWIGDKISGFCSGLLDGFKKGFDEHSPSKKAFEIGDLFTQGLANGLSKRFPDIQKNVGGFTKEIVGDFNKGFGEGIDESYNLLAHWSDNVSKAFESGVPELNLDIPDVNIPAVDSFDLNSLRTTMQMEIDAKMAQMEYETRQQNEILREQNELLREILAKPTLSDDDVFNSTRRGQQKFSRRTGTTGWRGID